MSSEESEYSICPFNRAHRVLKFRMPQHIIKCKKTYQGEKLSPCPYNAQHFFKEGEGALEKHKDECKDYKISLPEDDEYFKTGHKSKD